MSNENDPTVVLNGMAEDLTPIAYAAGKAIDEDTKRWNEAGGGDVQSLVTVLESHTGTLLRAISQLEMQIRENAGEIQRR